MTRRTYRCPAEVTLCVIAGVWKVPILYHLSGKVRRFSELRSDLGTVTQKVLTQQLRQLEQDGLVRRKVYAQVPPKVEYSLTSLGESLRPVIGAMCRWGEEHRSVMRRREDSI
jgi:DNA-binding HxlR family transcriptional regulator